MSAHRVFVRIASYRDPQLIPTLVDLIEQAAQPGTLRVVVCCQHAREETLDAFFANGFVGAGIGAGGEHPVHRLGRAGAIIELIDVPQLQSQGACWARHCSIPSPMDADTGRDRCGGPTQHTLGPISKEKSSSERRISLRRATIAGRTLLRSVPAAKRRRHSRDVARVLTEPGRSS